MRLVAGAVGILLISGCTAPPVVPDDAPSGTVTVLAAASLTDVFDELAARFEAEHPGLEVVLSYGGSSALAQQIVSGSPADVFASADESTMATVADAGLAEDPVVVATNVLELAVPVGNPGDVTGLADLADASLAIALCDPAVPCGAAAERLLAQEGIAASVDTLEEDVRAALTKVALGEVDAALVYRTDVIAAGGRVVGIALPEASSVVNRYPVARITGGANPGAAQAFLDFVHGEIGRRVLADAGFGTP